MVRTRTSTRPRHDVLAGLSDLSGADGSARRLAALMATCLQAALLISGGSPEVADLFCASRLGGDWGGVFGTLPAREWGFVVSPRLRPAQRPPPDRSRHGRSAFSGPVGGTTLCAMTTLDTLHVRRPGGHHQHRLPGRAGGDRVGRAARGGGDPRRARRPARLAQADRERELRLAGGAADDGHLVQRQVRRGHHRPPLLRRLPERRHGRGARRRARPRAVRCAVRLRAAALRHRRQPRRVLGDLGDARRSVRRSPSTAPRTSTT